VSAVRSRPTPLSNDKTHAGSGFSDLLRNNVRIINALSGFARAHPWAAFHPKTFS